MYGRLKLEHLYLDEIFVSKIPLMDFKQLFTYSCEDQ